ncbi:DUF2390 domain-containing protein [Temperatibacter marinus]|uniref:DUF2390 domain-containing protein n=1 Tax=Temperatibacter marinus TaxID=1456591 RepID=A0AA52EE32_9PROT|nr:DUF2390 domain-containing protein [Temperatibacter marinus]WND03091.1 DUF2390 domain-containing protein [Temperatibacter marinus]
MKMPTKEQMTLNKDEFWSFSNAKWQREELANALIAAQELYRVDCNLVLLFLYAAQQGLIIDNCDALYECSSAHQRSRLRPLRQARKGFAETSLYNQAKELELAAEKFAQDDYCRIALFEKGRADKFTFVEQLSDYLAYLSILAPASTAVELASEIWDR